MISGDDAFIAPENDDLFFLYWQPELVNGVHNARLGCLMLCYKCREDVSIELFSPDRTKTRGYQSYCKPCKRAYDKERSKKSKEIFLKDLVCAVCGASPPKDIHFHHLNMRKKEGGVGSMIGMSYSIKTIQREVDKCIVLCKSCHLFVHALVENECVAKYTEKALEWALETRKQSNL